MASARGAHDDDDPGQRDSFFGASSERTPLLQQVEPVPIPESEWEGPPPKTRARAVVEADIESAGDDGVDSWWAELRLLVRYSLPLVATYLLQYSHSVITTVAAGRLGPQELAAASVGMTTMNIGTWSQDF